MSHPHLDAQIGYIGLGNMGQAMAVNIQKHLATHNRSIIVYNRTTSRADPVVALGGILASSMSDVVSRCSIIFTSLTNDQVVLETYDNLFSNKEALSEEKKIFVEQSTVSPATYTKLAAQSAKHGVVFVACPVFGAPAAAVAAQLLMVLSGPADAKKKIEHLLTPVMGKKTVDLGEDVAKSCKLKLTGNFFITSMVEMLAEGLTLAEKSGIGQEPVLQFLDALFPNTPFSPYAQRMIGESFMTNLEAGERPLFSISNAKKDLTHAQDLARECGTKLQISDIMLGHLDRAKEEFGDIDYSGVVAIQRIDAGLPALLKKD